MAIKKVEALINHTTHVLKQKEGDIYQAEIAVPGKKLKTPSRVNYYPVTITAEDDIGNCAVRSAGTVEVRERNIFPDEFIIADRAGLELGFIRGDMEMDLDIGDTNDFELRLNIGQWKQEKYWYGHQIFIPGTEYGGLLEDMEVITKEDIIIWRGYTWRGLLMQKVIEPKSIGDEILLNGELNEVIGELVGDKFGSLLHVDKSDSGVNLSGWIIEAYTSLYEALMSLLSYYGYRLQLEYVQGERGDSGYVNMKAVPVLDWSEEIEYSQDSRVDFDIRDCKRGINHLVCMAENQPEGQEQEKIVLHLFIQKDGSIGDTRHYYGIEERTAVYSSSSADEEQLREDGSKRLRELQNYKKIQVAVDNVDLELGDIIAGRERITGTFMKKPVTGKILNASHGTMNVEYKIEGDD